MFGVRCSRWGALLSLCLLLTSSAGAQDAAQERTLDSNPPVVQARVTVAPPVTREVVAEGKAAIGVGGILGARKAAEAQALRNAVEKALGVFVSARTLTQNYVLVRDQVITRADGYATLKEVLKEEVGTQEVTVTVRAIVSLRPLADQLKALKLTRAWRVYVVAKSDGSKRGSEESTDDPVSGAVTTMERTLANDGFAVVSSEKDSDITVLVAPRYKTVAERQVEAGNVPMVMYSERSDLTVRATRTGTGEVVAAISGAETALHIERDTARTNANEDVMGILAPRLSEALMVLPAAQSQPVTLIVSGLSGIVQVSKIEDALNTLTGVRAVTRRSYAKGTATWELDVFNEVSGTLSRSLEESASLRSFGLEVAAESKSKISASTRSRRATKQ